MAKIEANYFMKNSRPKDAIKAIRKRLLAPKDFKVVMFTLTVSVILDSLPNPVGTSHLKKNLFCFHVKTFRNAKQMT